MVPSSSKFTAYIFPSKSVAGPSIPLVKLPSGVKSMTVLAGEQLSIISDVRAKMVFDFTSEAFESSKCKYFLVRIKIDSLRQQEIPSIFV